MSIFDWIKEKRKLALESRLKKSEAKMAKDMAEDEILKDYSERKAKVDEYNKKRKTGSPLAKVMDVIKNEVKATSRNPPAMFGKGNPLFETNDTRDKDAKKPQSMFGNNGKGW